MSNPLPESPAGTGVAIHQFSPSCSVGDGVSNSMMFIRRLLRSLGFASEIFADVFPPELSGDVRPAKALPRGPGTVLIVHHAFGYERDAWLQEFAGRAILVYHNITPEHLLPEAGPWRRLAALGREQLRRWRPWMIGAIGVSELNSAELAEAGYEHPRTLPLLVDVDAVRAAPWDPRMLERYRDTVNLLFVGRVAPHKRQDLLLEAFAEFLHFTDEPACLILAGAPMTDAYLRELRQSAAQLGIERHVDFLGPVTDFALRGLYRSADLFVCASDHEGFGMPLIEAALCDVPVLARATGNIPNTLGEGGLMWTGEDPREFGALIATVLREAGLRRRMLAGQRANLARFGFDRLRCDLARCLSDLGIRVPVAVSDPAPAAPFWRIEGPFDSSYSLAIVNRETARALQRLGQPVALSEVAGSSAPPLAPEKLAEWPDVAAMVERAADRAPPEVVLRDAYPPVIDAAGGRVRVLHGYGWEETGFPARFVEWFNRRLDLVSVLSVEVAKVLRDAGVRVPIVVTGGGVDQILSQPDLAPPCDLGKHFRFLHVSSCFPRKGVDVLLAAYGQAFRATDDVTLVVKTFPNPHNDVAAQLARCRASDDGYPDVVLIEEDWSDAQLAGLYRRCHALVAPSRGEGYGLPIAEAMAVGLPVITTAWGGQCDFATDDTAWLVDFAFAPARTHLDTDHSAWAEPDVAHLACLMREVREASPGAMAPRLTAARERVLRDHLWSNVAERLQSAVSVLDRMPALLPEPAVGLVSTWNVRCGIAGYARNLVAAIPPDRLTVFARRSAEPAGTDEQNVLRCWDTDEPDGQASGVPPDESSPAPGPGEGSLEDELVLVLDRAALDVVVIQYNFAFFSPARLGRLIARARQRDRQVHVFLHATQAPGVDALHPGLGAIVRALGQASRVYVHGVADLNRLSRAGVRGNVVLFPQGVPVPSPDALPKVLRPEAMSGRKVIASYGFLLPNKGLPDLLEAFASLDPVQARLHLLLCCALYPGPDSLAERDALMRRVAELGLGEHVTLVSDFLPDAESHAWLRMADLIVFPYQRTGESSSAAVRMGIASGRPVAVTPLPIFDDVADVVHRLPGSRPAEIAAGIAGILRGDDGSGERERARARFLSARGWPAVARRFADIVDGVAADCEFRRVAALGGASQPSQGPGYNPRS